MKIKYEFADGTMSEVEVEESIGVVIIDKVKVACESAKQNSGEENSFRQLRLNQWVKQAVRRMPMDKWDGCAFSAREDDLEGRVCCGGLDLSSTTDITAFVLVFPPLDEDDKYMVLPYFWIPEDTLFCVGIWKTFLSELTLPEILKPTKKNLLKKLKKIDGAVATIMGLDRAIRCGNVVTESVYDHRGILFL